MALTRDRGVPEKQVPHSAEFGHSVASGFRVYRGSIVAVCQDGTIVPAGTTRPTPTPVVAVVGIARQLKDNADLTGIVQGDSYGSHPIGVERGCFALPFDIAPTWADVGKPVYAVDDETVSLSSTGAAPASGTEGTSAPAAATRLQVGTLAGLEPDGTAFVTIL